MPVERKKILSALSVFKNPKLMKERYGITITQNQIEAAERAIHSYQIMTDAELRHIDERTAMRWPYTITEEQRYDRLLKDITMTIPQTILWKNIKAYLSKHTDERKTDPVCILQAMQDMEGFLQLNTYLGQFEENQKLLSGTDQTYLMKLFNTAYRKYQNKAQK